MTSNFYPMLDSSVTFSSSSYSIKENDGYMQVNMVLSNPASFDITLFIVPKSNTAMGNADIVVQLSSKITFTHVPDMSCTHFGHIPHAFWMHPASGKKGHAS